MSREKAKSPSEKAEMRSEYTRADFGKLTRGQFYKQVPKATAIKQRAKMKKTKLDAYEESILRDFEAGEFRSVKNKAKLRKEHSAYASNTLRKNKRINIRISGKDLEVIQNKAVTEGLPYQTLISSLIHKYASGQLVEKA